MELGFLFLEYAMYLFRGNLVCGFRDGKLSASVSTAWQTLGKVNATKAW